MTENITLNYKGVDLEIEYYWQPYERQTYDHPGSPAYVEEISEIKHKGTDMLELLEDQIDDLCELIAEKRNDETDCY